jgi:hydroxypyruvate reductase
MPRSASQLRDDALAIWQAGVDAVRSDALVSSSVRVDRSQLAVAGERFDLTGVRRIAVVGAGKAGAGMAAGLEAALGQRLMAEKELVGWINVPDDCLTKLRRIHLHGARPAGVNEPTEEGVRGADEILRIVDSLGESDLCLCLISGGGSALLPAPVADVTLADKQALTQYLSGAGANIEQLNTVRKQLSRIKGGGLARQCRAGRLVSLIISDVLGDPLDVIASGPTVEDTGTPQAALEVLEQFAARDAGVSAAVFDYLRQQCGRVAPPEKTFPADRVTNIILGNNAVAVDAAGREAERRGYSHAMTAATHLEGAAEDVGRHHAEMALRMRHQAGPDCLITGGEPTVRLVPAAERGLGGRNQQLVLAALDHLLEQQTGTPNDRPPCEGMVLLSGGTDGEDGPTDAAGAWIDADAVVAMRDRGLRPQEFLSRNDAYHFFQPLDRLIKTGPTHTNVCDLRVVAVDRLEEG